MASRLNKLLETKPRDGKLAYRVPPEVLKKMEQDFVKIKRTGPPWPTLRDIQQYVQEEYGVYVSTNTIRDRLTRIDT